MCPPSHKDKVPPTCIVSTVLSDVHFDIDDDVANEVETEPTESQPRMPKSLGGSMVHLAAVARALPVPVTTMKSSFNDPPENEVEDSGLNEVRRV
ncbi:hypothetical protein E2562_031425 [Oryza meyeriana var. granulata]|uniref:Uncharacterized protein n=1 Tax=Oryza meyeriana var. granulata TaxID=110450 RepID=A0A6G1C143_9ORYZ|nr:hypothetical protein E2562_031425 [Oryza meyeriana var. granulata]